MDRSDAAGRLKAERPSTPIACRVATSADSDAIAAFLAANPVGGAMALAFERSPDPFRADFGLSDNHVFVLAEDARTGALAGLCERTVYPAFFDGEAIDLPYLGALRVAAGYRNRISVVREGFAVLRACAEGPGEAGFALTSIAADNDRALRLLTAGVKGLPVYDHVGDLVTHVLRARRRPAAAGIRPATAAHFPAIAALLNRENARFHCAPRWTAKALAGLADHGLGPEHFLICGADARLSGVVAAWDQSARRQTVVRRYPRGLARFRPLWNLAGCFSGMPALPPSGARLDQVALTHLAVADGDPDLFLAMVDAALDQAARRGFASAFLGLSTANPLARVLEKRRRSFAYRTRLYLVHSPDRALPDFDSAMPFQPEAGLL